MEETVHINQGDTVRGRHKDRRVVDDQKQEISRLKRELNKTRLKLEDKSEMWLEFLGELIPLCVPEEHTLIEEHITTAANMADVVMEEWEKRFEGIS